MSTQTAADCAPFLERCFLFDAMEDSYSIENISGRIPDWLQGTYYINGPARFRRGELEYRHWLDGDGMICALRFERGSAWFRNRFVQTRKLREEEAAGRALYRSFGTRFPGDKLRRGLMLEPPVNVSVYTYAGRLLAFGEQALPYQLHPGTLETLGEYDFDGRLTEVTPFAAHPKLDPATGCMVNFGVSFSAEQPMLNVYEFDRCGCLLRRRRHELRFQHSNHDFGITPNYAVFYLSPLFMEFQKFWNGNTSVVEALRWDPARGSRILIAPRAAKSLVAFDVEAGDGYCLHVINCFESDGDTLTVDILELRAPAYPEYQPVPDLFRTITPCRPVRYIVHLPSRSLVERIPMEYDRSPDFPSPAKHLTGRPYNDFWMLGISAAGKAGRKFFDQLVHGSWSAGAVNDIFQAGPGQYLGGEPLLVQNPDDPDEAVIINELVDAQADRAEIVLFDAAHVAGGPIAHLGLKHKIHLGFHTSFEPAQERTSLPAL
jgi:all-trans-8'-apo-beta-carotenal 15,15'-oxygenase